MLGSTHGFFIQAPPDERLRQRKESCTSFCGITPYFPCGVFTWLICLPWAVISAILYHINPSIRPTSVDIFSKESCADRNRADRARQARAWANKGEFNYTDRKKKASIPQTPVGEGKSQKEYIMVGQGGEGTYSKDFDDMGTSSNRKESLWKSPV